MEGMENVFFRIFVIFLVAQHKAIHRRLSCEGVEDVRVVSVCVQDMQDALSKIPPSAMKEVSIEVPEVCLLVASQGVH